MKPQRAVSLDLDKYCINTAKSELSTKGSYSLFQKQTLESHLLSANQREAGQAWLRTAY